MAPRTPQIPEHLRNLARGRVAKREELTLLEGNPNQGDVEMVARSLLRFGQKTPIVLSPEGVVVKGNTTTQAADLLVAGGLDGLDPLPEWNELWVIDDAEEDVSEQLAYALADNRTARAGEDDPGLLLAMLERIDDHHGIGYEPDDIADLRAAMQEDDGSRFGATGVTEGEPAYADLVDDYTAKGIRSLVLDFPLADFEWIVEHADAVRRELGVETNAGLFLALLRAHVEAKAASA
jgi:hypothetical protein